MVRSLPKKLPVKEIIAKNKEEEHQTSTRQKCSRERVDWSLTPPRSRLKRSGSNVSEQTKPKQTSNIVTPSSKSRKTTIVTSTPDALKTPVRRSLMADVKRNLSGRSPIHSTPDLKRTHRHLNNQSLLSSKKIPTGSPARKKKRMTETQILSLITESDNSNVISPDVMGS